MGMDLYLYACDEKPVSPRYPWYTDDEYVKGTGIIDDNVVVYTEDQLQNMKDFPDKDKEIAEWHRRHDLHGYFHRIFKEKGGIYAFDETQFCIPDILVLTLDDLYEFQNVLYQNRLPETHKYAIAPQIPTLDSMNHEWVTASHKRRREIISRMNINATYISEDLKIAKKAINTLKQGKYIYVCASW